MSAIHKAAKAGDVRSMERLLSQGADLAFHDEKDGYTPLMAACLSEKAGVDAVRLLLDYGADIHTIDKGKYALGRELIGHAIRSASIDKIRLLLERGANLVSSKSNDCTLLTIAAYANRMDVFDLLLDAGAPIDGKSSHGESALGVLSNNARFRKVAKLLELGADPAPLGWSALHRALALGSLDEVSGLLEVGADLEAKDSWDRTPFLLGIQTGDIEKVALLLERGADRTARGKCGAPTLHYAVDPDHPEMLAWLLEKGFDIDAEDDFGSTAIMEAVVSPSPECFHVLIGAGASWEKCDAYGDPLIKSAEHPAIVKRLIELGANPSDLEADVTRRMVGLGTEDELPVSKEDFTVGRARRFGTANPERMEMVFWEAMVRNGWSGFQAADQFGVCSYDEQFDTGVRNPVWSHDRFGMSLTILPDGRFVQIAGEHEDGYDPDFCIYNDVFVHDGKGGIEIFGYPKEVFPPTDFHSATFIAPWIYVIGNLGYPETREEYDYETPVFRLHTEAMKMERVIVAGESPGWIHSHRAEKVEQGIRISGGKILKTDGEGCSEIVAHEGIWILDLEKMVWRRG